MTGIICYESVALSTMIAASGRIFTHDRVATVRAGNLPRRFYRAHLEKREHTDNVRKRRRISGDDECTDNLAVVSQRSRTIRGARSASR